MTAGRVRLVKLRIRREVPTPGLASCDTHIHTFTCARHGDATLEERILTLAGETTELPVSSEHFSFNAVELINSGALGSDWRQVYHEWFALLNYGHRVTGVAGSDSHDVSRFSALEPHLQPLHRAGRRRPYQRRR